MKILILVGLMACMVVAEDDNEMARQYLGQYHYISPSRSGNHDEKTALQNFQAFAGLPVTGELDPATIEQMKKPRCGVPDVDESGLRIKRFVRGTSKWEKKSLTFHISYGRDLPEGTQRRIFHKALGFWAAVSGLSFRETGDGRTADIRISFGGREHGGPFDPTRRCKYPFDGKGKVLAHAFMPPNGRAHFDEDEDFTDGTPDGTNLLWVATHELGHSLGLAHSNVQEAVMYPFYTGYVKGFNLRQDDKDGIRAIYGRSNSRGWGIFKKK